MIAVIFFYTSYSMAELNLVQLAQAFREQKVFGKTYGIWGSMQEIKDGVK